MVLQDFDPLQHTVPEFVSFCERMEQIELQEGTAPTSTKNQNKKGSGQSQPSMSKKRGRESTEQQSSTDKYCMLHGPNSHPTSQCRTLQAQAKRMKATYEAQTPENKRKLKEKQELHAIIAESVEQALKNKKKKPSRSNKKRSREESELDHFEQLSISDSEGSAGSSSDTSDDE